MKDSYYEEEEEAFDNEGMGNQIRPKYKDHIRFIINKKIC